MKSWLDLVMIFDELGLPKDTGATDWLDSSRLAGLLTVFGWPRKIELQKYICPRTQQFIRHPLDVNPKTFSRDQLIPLVAGMVLQPGALKHAPLPKGFRVINGDLLSPSQRNHLRLCTGRKRTWFGDLWLKLDILWSAYIQPMAEPNQLLCMLMVAGPSYVRLWKRHHRTWREAIRAYWSTGPGAWRAEPELAEFLIRKIEAV